MEIKINIYHEDNFCGTYRLALMNSEYYWVRYYIYDASFGHPDKNLLCLQATEYNWNYKFSPEHLKGGAIPYED